VLSFGYDGLRLFKQEWAKTIGGLRKSRFIGREKLDFQFVMTYAAYNLIRMRNLGVVSC
jgi:hypothetical protein